MLLPEEDLQAGTVQKSTELLLLFFHCKQIPRQKARKAPRQCSCRLKSGSTGLPSIENSQQVCSAHLQILKLVKGLDVQLKVLLRREQRRAELAQHGR